MRKRLDNNAILSITATIVSVCALFVAVYQTILMRQQQDAAVWPKVLISHGYYKDDFYRIIVRNVGVGPAIIRKASITGNGQSFPDMGIYEKFLLTKYQLSTQIRDSTSYFDYSDLQPEDVIPQGEQREICMAKGKAIATAFIKNESNFHLDIIYESLYGKQWTTCFHQGNITTSQ